MGGGGQLRGMRQCAASMVQIHDGLIGRRRLANRRDETRQLRGAPRVNCASVSIVMGPLQKKALARVRLALQSPLATPREREQGGRGHRCEHGRACDDDRVMHCSEGPC